MHLLQTRSLPRELGAVRLAVIYGPLLLTFLAPLEPICFTNISKDINCFTDFRVQPGPGANYGQSFEDSWHPALDSEFQLNPFDESRQLYYFHGVGTKTVHPNTAPWPPNQTQLSTHSFDFTQASDAFPTVPTVSIDFERSSHVWDSEAVLPVNEPNTLPAIHNTEALLKNTAVTAERTIALNKYTGSQPLNWEHMSSKDLESRQAVKGPKHPRKAGGRRRGRLNPDTAKDAKEMRHLRACLPCSILKTKVSRSRHAPVEQS
jgi:hypothetical protein